MSDSNDLLIKIFDKVERIDDKVAAIDITTARQQVTLDEHIKRTEILEVRTEKIFEELKPIKLHVSMVHGSFKIIAWVVALISAIVGILSFFGKI